MVSGSGLEDEGRGGKVLLELFANQHAFETQLPDYQQHVVKELQAYATAKPGFGRCSDARSAGPEGRVGVFTSACGGAEDVDQG